MRKALGYELIIDPTKPVEEYDTFTCLHCQFVQRRKPFCSPTDEAIGAYCHMCDGPICLGCVGKGCIPFEKKLDQLEKRRWMEEALR